MLTRLSHPSFAFSHQYVPPLTMQQRRHGLQGPRPATLKVTNTKAAGMGVKRRRRPPVIIFVESPKVVHAHPGEFKSVVQRLTGAPPSSSASSALTTPPPPLQFPFHLYGQLPLSASPLPADDAAAGGLRSSLGFFITDDRHQLASPAAAFLYDHQSTVAFAGPAVQPLVLPPSLGAFYRHGDLFVNQLQ